VRRSGRISKKVPIVLIGTDETGKVFSERTTAVVLSRHGAGILSQYTFAPEETLALRIGEPSCEASVRLVGCIGETDRGHIYGVEFLDPSINYWGIDFPAPDEYPGAAEFWLECTLCHERRKVEPSEIERDVFLTTDKVFRFCERCGQTTPWQRAAEASAPPQPPTSNTAVPPASAEPAGKCEERRAPQDATPPGAPTATTGILEVVPAGAASVLDRAASPERRENRRKHIRTRVSFKGCVRYRGFEEEMVECENISKGGLCFRGHKHYPEDAQIEVAAPYEPGTPAIFVPAQIRHVEKLLGGTMFRHGAAYLRSAAT
jgi:hypothetical protein